MKTLHVLSIGMLAAAAPLHAQTAPPPPPCATPEYRQMDFWVGEWELEFKNPNGTTGTASNRITKDEFGSCVITEHFLLKGGRPDGSDYIGGSYSIYDVQTKTWRQYWVDNSGGMFDLRGGPVTGQKHQFELVTVEPRGPNKATLRMIWEDVTADALTWRWQSRNEDGSWTDRWVLKYNRKPAHDGGT